MLFLCDHWHPCSSVRDKSLLRLVGALFKTQLSNPNINYYYPLPLPYLLVAIKTPVHIHIPVSPFQYLNNCLFVNSFSWIFLKCCSLEGVSVSGFFNGYSVYHSTNHNHTLSSEQYFKNIHEKVLKINNNRVMLKKKKICKNLTIEKKTTTSRCLILTKRAQLL